MEVTDQKNEAYVRRAELVAENDGEKHKMSDLSK